MLGIAAQKKKCGTGSTKSMLPRKCGVTLGIWSARIIIVPNMYTRVYQQQDN